MVSKVGDGTVGRRIASLRTNGKISQDDLGAACNVSRQTISKWEKGKSHITFTEAVKICDFFKCDIGYLTGEHETLRRVNAEIQSVIGLSDKAIDVLKEINQIRHCLLPGQFEENPNQTTLLDYECTKQADEDWTKFISKATPEELFAYFQEAESSKALLHDMAVQFNNTINTTNEKNTSCVSSKSNSPNYLLLTLSELLCSPEFFTVFLRTILDYKFSHCPVQSTHTLKNIKDELGSQHYEEFLLQAAERNFAQMLKGLYPKSNFTTQKRG